MEINETISTQKRIDELGDSRGEYKKKVKKNCFMCGFECNPTLDFGYYCYLGNCCRACSADINHKMNSPEGLAFRRKAAKLMTVNGREKVKDYDEIEIPDEAL
ncbi:MAG: hypothetical protein NTW30_06075 [Candidatus Aenigmarchaeota archaeon]|nr:hypothetical protein [Candidatus Aenigmarchaeota archaeon]